jgi:hypothetical protein
LGRGPAHGLSLGLGAVPAFGGAGADQIALDIGQAAENRDHQPPGDAVAESAIAGRVSATVASTRTAAVIDAVTAPIVALTVTDSLEISASRPRPPKRV